MKRLDELLDAIEGGDDQAREPAYLEIVGRSVNPADLASHWSRLEALLVHKNNHVRSIAGKLYAYFAAYDPEGPVWDLWNTWTKVAMDPMFVTARHTIQASPRFALGGKRHREHLLQYYAQRFKSCDLEKNTTLVRYDLQVCLRAVYDQRPDPAVAELARSLIEREADVKYQTKYKTVWKKIEVRP